jgi:4-oxalocrotonate tautomerase
MPHIVVHRSGSADAALDGRIAVAVTTLTAEILGKKPEVTAVAVLVIPHDQWFIAGRPLSALGGNAFHLDITITDETNLKAEKARYLAAIHAAMAALIGPLNPHSYIHVMDARAAAYGYGGLTQEFRYHHPDAGT